ncbi:MAG: PQQ-like beta-propeller repeat protein [Anaerolineae bacterium]|nr:PQQ-like beta-propeller repeat protein [Anaerolineae bacterium]
MRNIRKSRTLIIIITLVITAVLTLAFSDNHGTIDTDALSHVLQPVQSIPLNNIPSGDYSAFTNDQILYMGTVWQNGPTPKKLTAYSTVEKNAAWSLNLPASPLGAVLLKDTLLVATANHLGKGHIIGINPVDGKLLWDQADGNSIMAMTTLDDKAWVISSETVYQINPSDGQNIQTMVTWESLPNSSDWRTITSIRNGEQVMFAVSIGRDIYVYSAAVFPWELLWHFRAAKTIIELRFFEDWQVEHKPVLIALSHSGAYAINPSGETIWNIRNNDLNRDALSVNCGGASKHMVFRNIMSGVYLMNAAGEEASWELPGGSVKVLGFPIPIPQNPAFGLTVADLDNDGIDEIIANSASSLFVFDCKGTLLAYTPINSGQGGSFASLVRGAPRYSPVIFNHQILIAERGQVSIFIYKLK